MNELFNPEQTSSTSASIRIRRVAKIIGGGIVGGVVAYGAAKGMEQIVDISNDGPAQLFESALTIVGASASAMLITELTA